LDKVESSFKWETLPLFLVPIGTTVAFIDDAHGGYFIGVSVVLVLICNAYFAVGITWVFLRPVIETLDMVTSERRLTPAFKDLQRTKHATFVAASLSLFSTTLLYLGFIIWASVFGIFWSNPWLSPMVFGQNLDSVINGVCMLLISGTLTQFLTTASLKRSKKVSKGTRVAVAPLAMHGESGVVEDRNEELVRLLQLKDGVQSIINREVKTLEQLRELAPGAIQWLKESLPLAHKDAKLKARAKQLLGNEFFISNLEHLNAWGDLIQYCSAQALEMGKEMHAYFEQHHLGDALGAAYVTSLPPLPSRIYLPPITA
jgi:hypothetical protein